MQTTAQTNDSGHVAVPVESVDSRLEPVGCTWMNLGKGWGKPVKEIGFTAPTYIPTDKLTPVYEVPAGYVIVPIEPTSADARDAARYRWLRDKSDSGNLDLPYPVKRKYIDGQYMQFAFEPAELDAAIDAALAEAGANN